MKEYALFLDRRLVRCSTSKAAIWELLVRLVRELQVSEILPQRLVANPIAFSRSQGVLLSIQERNVGAASDAWREIPNWCGPPKKPRGKHAFKCSTTALTMPEWLRAWIVSSSKKLEVPSNQQAEPPRPDFPEAFDMIPDSDESAWPDLASWDEQRLLANGWLVDEDNAAHHAPVATPACRQSSLLPNGAETLDDVLGASCARMADAERPKLDLATRKDRLCKWLNTARCRLDFAGYKEFRKALRRWHSGREVPTYPELRSLAALLWCADFPEGASVQATWIVGFEESLPLAARRVWCQVVSQFAPTRVPTSFPDRVSEDSSEMRCSKTQPSVDTIPNFSGRPCSGQKAGTFCAAKTRCKERGWLIERSAVFLNRKRRSESLGDATASSKLRRERL